MHGEQYTLISIQEVLWDASRDGGACPSVLPFCFIFPETYRDRDDGRVRPLPPTYDPRNDSAILGDLDVQCSYRENYRLTVNLAYVPRSLAHRPILAYPFPFLITCKTAPEEWYEICTTIDPGPSSTCLAIDCNVRSQWLFVLSS